MQKLKPASLVLLMLLILTACSESTAPLELEPNTINNPLEAAISVTDFAGNTIELSKPAQRIVALAPHIVENVFSAGAGNQLVGVVSYSDYPEAAKSLPIVGGYQKTNLEKILELRPSLIVAWQSGNSQGSIQRLQELGFTVYIDQADSLKDVAKSILDIGILSGHREHASRIANEYLAELAEIQKDNQDKQKVSSFYQVWNSPLQTISGDHIISNAIEICGGTNIYADEFAVAPIINIESILQRDPTVIIASGMSEARPEWLSDWLKWPSLTAVQQDNLFFVNPNHIQRHTIRLLRGIATICKQLDMAREKNAQP